MVLIGRFVSQLLPTLLGVVTVLFLLIRLLPGDPAQAMLGSNATAADLSRLRHELGLDRSLLTQYGIYITDLATGQWGKSLATGEPVVRRIQAALPPTLFLCVASILLIIAISIPAGVISAVKRNSALDYGISIVVFLLMSMPQFWLGLLLLLVLSYWLDWFPIFGNGADGDLVSQFHHLVLPAVTLAAGFFGLTTRLTRSSMLEVLGRDFVRTARAKGLSEGAVIVKHALRNALLSVVTVIGLTFGQLLGGAVIVEVLFARTGIGTMIWDSILQRDYPQLQACVAVFATLFILINFLTDLLYRVLNPRLRT
jgi:peptide/nickel transport system permease protein